MGAIVYLHQCSGVASRAEIYGPSVQMNTDPTRSAYEQTSQLKAVESRTEKTHRRLLKHKYELLRVAAAGHGSHPATTMATYSSDKSCT